MTGRRRLGAVVLGASVAVLAFAGGSAAAGAAHHPSGPPVSPLSGFAPLAAADAGGATTGPVAGGEAGPVPGSFSGDVEAFAVRVEADEPLPAGTGDVPYLFGEMNSDNGSDKGDVAADRLGAVTGPKLSDPTGDGKQYASDPESACSYPSSQQSGAQSYPLDGSDQQTAQSEITCAAGPAVTGLAYSAGVGGNAGATSDQALAHNGVSPNPFGAGGAAYGSEQLGPDPRAGDAAAAASASVTDFSLPGIVSVAGVQAVGVSRANGRPGGAATAAHVTVTGLRVGTAVISLSDAGITLGSGAPVPVGAAQPLVDAFNRVAGANGCSLTVLRDPATYPQSPLFERPPLPNRVAADGTDAGSTAAGFYLRCAVPDNLNPTNFKPLILHIVFGFVGTEIRATTAPASGSATGGNLGAGASPASPGPAGGGSDVQDGLLTAGPGGNPPTGGGPVPASRAGASAPAVERRLGPLVGLDGGMEAAGGLIGIVGALVGLGLLGPWRVPLAAGAAVGVATGGREDVG